MNSPIASSPTGGASPLNLAESVAGEEDPGASIRLSRCGGSGKLAGRDCPVCQGIGN